MNITVNAVHFKADQKLIDFAEAKISKLLEKNDSVISADITLVYEKSDKLQNKEAEIKLKMSGNELFSKKKTNSFEESIDTAIEALRKQVAKVKEKK